MRLFHSRQSFLDKLDDRLQRDGFRSVSAHNVLQNGERIYNRGNTERSNFYVFVKTSALGVFVKYFDPDPCKPLDSCMKREFFFAGSDETVKKRVSELSDGIHAASGHKPTDAYSVVTHGHWKDDGTKRLYFDDGASSARLILRDLMFFHTDFDFTGHHNIIDFPTFEQIRASEHRLGITKALATELTLPLSKGKSNGPHFMLWSYDPDTMAELHDSFLLRRDNKMIYPSLAPCLDLDVFLDWLGEKLRAKSIAVGIAHPFEDVSLPLLKPVPIGLFSVIGDEIHSHAHTSDPFERKLRRFDLSRALALAKLFGNGVAEYNSTIWATSRKISDPETLDFIEKLKRKYGIEGDTANVYGRLISKYLEETFGLFRYFEPDFHVSPSSGSLLFYLGRRVYSKLSTGHTWFLSDKGRPGVKDVVLAMHDERRKFETAVRWKIKNGAACTDDSINGFLYTSEKLYWEVVKAMNHFRAFLWESKRRIGDIFR